MTKIHYLDTYSRPSHVRWKLFNTIQFFQICYIGLLKNYLYLTGPGPCRLLVHCVITQLEFIVYTNQISIVCLPSINFYLYFKYKNTYHTSMWIFSSITECWSQCWRTRLVIVSIFSIVDSRIYRYSPHAGSITITVAIIIFTSITWCPNINISKATATLKKLIKWRYE